MERIRVRSGEPRLLAGRIVEQVTLGGAFVLLAGRLTAVDFAPVSALLLLLSLAITLSDLGLGLRILALPNGADLPRAQLARLRRGNSVVVVAGLAVAAFLPGDIRVVAAAAGVLWLASSESFVRKAAAVRRGHLRAAATADVAGSVAFAACVAVGLVDVELALWATAAACVAKLAVEIVVLRSSLAPIEGGAEYDAPWLRSFVLQLLTYSCGNVDYLLVAALVGERPFAVYSLAFRVANFVPSQLGYVVGRVTLAEVGDATTTEDRQAAHDRLLPTLAAAGGAASVLLCAGAPLVAALFGETWTDLGPVLALLGLGALWRLLFGPTWSAYVAAAPQPPVGLEAARLAASVAVLAAGCAWGVVGAGAASSLLAVGSCLLYAGALRRVGVRPWRLLGPAAALTVAAGAAVLAVTQLG